MMTTGSGTIKMLDLRLLNRHLQFLFFPFSNSFTGSLPNVAIKLISWTSGWKTYATVAIGIAIGVYSWYTGHDVPSYVYLILGCCGFGFTRSAISTETRNAIEAAVVLGKDVVSQTTVTVTPTVPTPASIKPGDVIPVTGSTVKIVVGQPSPKGVDETAITDSLNDAELKAVKGG